jgi:uncharacterized tellurite resistance protein B-like protein
MAKRRKNQFLDLYRMVMADGIAHPKEMETLYRIGIEKYNLSEEEIGKDIAAGGSSTVVPELFEERILVLYEMAIIAWADGIIEDSERNLLRRYAVQYGVQEDKADELINFLLEKAKDNTNESEVIKLLV